MALNEISLSPGQKSQLWTLQMTVRAESLMGTIAPKEDKKK